MQVCCFNENSAVVSPGWEQQPKKKPKKQWRAFLLLCNGHKFSDNHSRCDATLFTQGSSWELWSCGTIRGPTLDKQCYHHLEQHCRQVTSRWRLHYSRRLNGKIKLGLTSMNPVSAVALPLIQRINMLFCYHFYCCSKAKIFCDKLWFIFFILVPKWAVHPGHSKLSVLLPSLSSSFLDISSKKLPRKAKKDCSPSAEGNTIKQLRLIPLF